ncbi:MAG: hypothetical protein ACRDRH_09780 [Pseudonocardia sp.]
MGDEQHPEPQRYCSSTIAASNAVRVDTSSIEVGSGCRPLSPNHARSQHRCTSGNENPGDRAELGIAASIEFFLAG